MPSFMKCRSSSCGNCYFGSPNMTAQIIESEASRHGWEKIGPDWFCPHCKPQEASGTDIDLPWTAEKIHDIARQVAREEIQAVVKRFKERAGNHGALVMEALASELVVASGNP